LERARAYNRRIEDQDSLRAKSLERAHSDVSQQDDVSPRSKSTGRQQVGNRASTRERAMASVRQDQYRQSQENISSNNRNQHVTPRQSNAQRQQFTEPTKPIQHSETKHSPRIPQENNKSREVPQNNNNNEQPPQEAIVSPELLVDALSGHEDGLLAIAERLMEHYDAGYDVMGEAIIDAFADVQKLFQHVVEAAHMEGAAFEAQRREAEITELRKKAGQNIDITSVPPSNDAQNNARHDEFVDQDVKDVLSEAIRKGSSLRDSNQQKECLRIYEQACQSSSSLLPVDSDHRGRLQLSIARAESMSEDRACAILRYAMDDVLRSGLRVGNSSMEVSKRSDMVLSKPKDYPSLTGKGQSGVVQSSEEALASLVEEMKEVMSAPVYENTPLQSVSGRFWNALGDAQRAQQRHEEKIEQSLGKLKGDYLLAKAEWEEKLSVSQEENNRMKRKFLRQKENMGGEIYMDKARQTLSSRWNNEGRDIEDDLGSSDSQSFQNKSVRSGSGSVVSISSGLAQSARQIVGSFNCSGLNERSGPVVASELSNKDTVPMSKSYSYNQSQSSKSREGRPSASKTRRGRSSTKRPAAYRNNQTPQAF